MSFAVDRLKEERRSLVRVDEQLEVVLEEMRQLSVEILALVQIETEVLLENELVFQVDRHLDLRQISADLQRTVVNELLERSHLLLRVQASLVQIS